MLQLQQEGPEGARLATQLPGLHASAVTSVDVQPETRALLTAGADGGVCVVDGEAQTAGMEPPPVVQLFAASTCEAYNNARWADTSTFVTVCALLPGFASMT
jgi:hypothetical protein